MSLRPVCIRPFGETYADPIMPKHVSTEEAIRWFFEIPAHQQIETLDALLEKADQFCNDHTRVHRDTFLLAIREYAASLGIEGANAVYVSGLNIHEGDRDARTMEALGLLCKHQGPISDEDINLAERHFANYIEASPFTVQQKAMAVEALVGKESDRSNALVHAYFLHQENYIATFISGRELIGRLWTYTAKLYGPDVDNARYGMISSLAEDFDGCCNLPKLQRLVVAVLQGRLRGVRIDGDIIPDQMTREGAMNRFFMLPAHQQIETLSVLLDAAHQFCNKNPDMNRDDFLADINEYAAIIGIE